MHVYRTAVVAEEIWAQTFKYLADNKVLFEGMLLKPSMVTPGADSGKKVRIYSHAYHAACSMYCTLLMNQWMAWKHANSTYFMGSFCAGQCCC